MNRENYVLVDKVNKQKEEIPDILSTPLSAGVFSLWYSLSPGRSQIRAKREQRMITFKIGSKSGKE